MKTPKNKTRKKSPSFEADLEILSLGAQGDGLSSYQTRDVYVENALAGEVVRAILTAEGNHSYRARIKTIFNPSSERISPPCRHFEKCGGCRLQHMHETAYQTWKSSSVRDYLRVKNIEPQQWDDDIFIPPHTRRRVTLTALKQKETLIMGFHQRQSNMVFNLKQCELLTPQLYELLPDLREFLTPLLTDRQTVSIFMQQAENGIDMVLTGQIGPKREPDLNVLEAVSDFARHHPICRVSWRAQEKEKPEILIEQDKPFVTFGNLQVPLAPMAFLQPSKEGEAALSDTILAYLDGEEGSQAVDLFAGCGTFTGRLRQKGMSVDAFEGEAEAIAQLKAGGHQQAYGRDLFREPLTGRELKDYDCVVIDPPRAGAKAQSETLAQSDVPVIVAVSCNPATFARDARMLIDGGYHLERLTVIDQFIWSAHTELVAKFAR